MAQSTVDYKAEFEKGRQYLNNVRTDEEAIVKALCEFAGAITVAFKVCPAHHTASNDRAWEIVLNNSRVLLRVSMVAKYELARPYDSAATIYPVKLQHPGSGVEVEADDLEDLKGLLGYFARHPRFVEEVLTANS